MIFERPFKTNCGFPNMECNRKTDSKGMVMSHTLELLAALSSVISTNISQVNSNSQETLTIKIADK